MIKVLNRKIEGPKIYKTICDECGAELEYEEVDTYIGALGGRELICPLCNEKIFIEDIDGIDLNSHNIEFPIHFIAPSDNAVDIEDEKIQEYVRKCLEKVENDPECEFYITGTGNTVVIALKFEDEYDVYVTKRYYECSISR